MFMCGGFSFMLSSDSLAVLCTSVLEPVGM